MEAAERSIAAVNGATVEGVQLEVSYARRQPKIEPINDASTSSAWSTIGKRPARGAASAEHAEKGRRLTCSGSLERHNDSDVGVVRFCAVLS